MRAISERLRSGSGETPPSRVLGLIGLRPEAGGAMPDPNPGGVHGCVEDPTAVDVAAAGGRRGGVGADLSGHLAGREANPVEVVGGKGDRRSDAGREAVKRLLCQLLRPRGRLGYVGNRREEIGVDEREMEVAGRGKHRMSMWGKGRERGRRAPVARGEDHGVECCVLKPRQSVEPLS